MVQTSRYGKNTTPLLKMAIMTMIMMMRFEILMSKITISTKATMITTMTMTVCMITKLWWWEHRI